MNPPLHPPGPPLAWPGRYAWPIGSVIPYAGPLADSDTGSGIDLAQIRTELAAAGWLYCDGSAYACLDYVLLYAVIGKSFGSATNGSVEQFLVPDLRGRFIRGVDVAGGIDPGDRKTPSGDKSFAVGTVQADAFQGHEHDYTACGEGEMAGPSEGNVLGSLPLTSTTGILEDTDDSGTDDGSPRTSTETRPVNLALNYLIRWA